MKSVFKKVTLLGLGCLALAGCSNKETLISFDSQLDAVTQLNNGTVDAAIIDSVMAGYYTKTGEFSNSIAIVPDVILSQEEYAIAGRKSDQAFMDKINEGLIATYNNGKLNDIASYFGLTDSLAINSQTTSTSSATDNSWNKILSSGKIIVGYTVFAPIAYIDSENNYSNNSFTGFDTELARSVVSYLNDTYSQSLTIEFKEIDWDSKEALLANGTIDLIWNGLTVTDERKENMSMSISYMYNNQVAVVKKSDLSKYTTKDSLKDAILGFESGSAGEDAAKELKGM